MSRGSPPSVQAVLVELVDCYEQSGEPVSTTALARSLGVPERTLVGRLESLREFDLLATAEGGHRPTATAYDLLAAGIDLEDALVVDVVEEDS